MGGISFVITCGAFGDTLLCTVASKGNERAQNTEMENSAALSPEKDSKTAIK